MNGHLKDAALIVIDVQRGFDHPDWGRRNNPEAEGNIAELLAAWRLIDLPVLHVHHDSPAEAGLLRRGSIGHHAKIEATPAPTEPVYLKTVNNAFLGTRLEADLLSSDIGCVVIVGLTTNHCVSTTARMAANLGFVTFVVSDATAAFGRPALDGRIRPAAEVHDAALSDLKDEFAEIVDTRAAIAALPSTGVHSSKLRVAHE